MPDWSELLLTLKILILIQPTPRPQFSLKDKNDRPLVAIAACPAPPAQQGAPENTDDPENPDAQDNTDTPADQEKFAENKRNKPAHHAPLEAPDLLDPLDPQVMLEPQANPAAQDKIRLAAAPAQLDPKEHPERPDLKEPLEMLEPQLKAHPVNLEMPDLLEMPEPQDPLDPLETQAKTPKEAPLDLLDLLDPPETMVHPVNKDPQAHQEVLENKGNAVFARNIARWTVGSFSRMAPSERHKARNPGRQHCLYQPPFLFDKEADALLFFLSIFSPLSISFQNIRRSIFSPYLRVFLSSIFKILDQFLSCSFEYKKKKKENLFTFLLFR